MYSLLAYIIQVNILLAIVYVGYYVLLRKLTFYRLNRFYFLIGVFFTFIYPFFDLKSLFLRHIEPVGEWMTYLPDYYVQQVEKSVYTLENVMYSAIAIVGLCFAIRLGIQLLSLLRIHLYSRKTIWKTYWYQDVLFPIVPFSFLNKIYLHKQQHQEPELYDIFEHEGIHVKGLHSMDILMFEILLIVCWYNPFVWLMRRAVRQNLEYLTDQQVLNKGVDRQTYQYSLLNVSKQGASLGVSSQFNFKFLKKRIMMMNKKQSSKLQLSKYAFLLPIVIFSAGAFTISKADGKITEAVKVMEDVRFANVPIRKDTTKTAVPVTKILKNKSEIDQTRNYLYLYDNREVSKDSFFQIDDSELFDMLFVSEVDLKGPYAVHKDREGVISAYSNKEHTKRKKQQEHVLIVVDGEIQGEGKAVMDAINPNQVESINVLKDESATEKYGDKGKNGVMEFTMKTSKVDAGFVVTGYHSEMPADSQEGKATRIRIVGTKGQTNVADTTKLPRIVVKGVKNEGTSPLIVIDGVVQPIDMRVDELNQNQIESISILKDQSAVAIYGDKAKNGVLRITTKTGAKAGQKEEDHRYTDDDVFFIDGKAVSKNEFIAIPENKVVAKDRRGKTGEKGREIEIKTRK